MPDVLYNSLILALSSFQNTISWALQNGRATHPPHNRLFLPHSTIILIPARDTTIITRVILMPPPQSIITAPFIQVRQRINHSTWISLLKLPFLSIPVLVEGPHHHHHHHSTYCSTADYHSTPTTLTPLLGQATNPSIPLSTPATHQSNCPSSGYLAKGGSTVSAELDALNPLPPALSYAGSYGNASNSQLMPINAAGGQPHASNSWSPASGYTSLQYPSCGTASVPGQYSSTPTMVLYPQLYSTVNQNQIHLHLHATATPDKIEQYLGSAPASTAMDSSVSSALLPPPTTTASIAERVEIGNSDNNNNSGGNGEIVSYGGSGEGSGNENLGQTNSHQTRDAITTESVWRPY